MSKSTIAWRGDKGAPEGHYSKSNIMDVIDMAALTALGTALLALTDCNLASRHYVDKATVNDVLPGADVNVDRRAIVYLRNAADGRVRSITIPGIVATACELTDAGERVTAAALATIAAALSTATGLTLTALWGKVIQKS